VQNEVWKWHLVPCLLVYGRRSCFAMHARCFAIGRDNCDDRADRIAHLKPCGEVGDGALSCGDGVYDMRALVARRMCFSLFFYFFPRWVVYNVLSCSLGRVSTLVVGAKGREARGVRESREREEGKKKQ